MKARWLVLCVLVACGGDDDVASSLPRPELSTAASYALVTTVDVTATAVLPETALSYLEMLRMLREHFPSALVAVEELGVGFKVTAPFPDGELDGTPRVVPFEELTATPVTRLTLRDPSSTSEEFLERTERIGLHGVEYAVGWSAWLDINPEGVSKGAALEAIRRRLGVEPMHTVAVGDQRNDLEMLQWAARGVAMGNAPDEVKAAADEVTGHVDDDGLVPVLLALL